MADYHYFFDAKRVRVEKQADGTSKVWIWIALSFDETGKNLPEGPDWTLIELRTGGNLDGEWLNPRTIESATDEERDNGYFMMGELRATKRKNEYEELWLVHQPRKAIVWQLVGDKWNVRQSMGYCAPEQIPKGEGDDLWVLWSKVQLDNPLASWNDELIGDIKQKGLHKYTNEREVDEVFAKIITPKPKVRIYWFEDDNKTVEKYKSTIKYSGWSNDPDGRNLPAGNWKIFTVVDVDEYDAFKYISIDKVRSAILENGFLVDWVEYPYRFTKASASVTETVVKGNASMGSDDPVQAAFDEVFRKK